METVMSFGRSALMKKIVFFSGTALSGLFIVPTLASVTPVLLLSGPALILYGILALNGVVPGTINYGGTQISGILPFVAALIASAGLFFLGRLCWKLLKKYLAFISAQYQKIKAI